MEFSIWDVLIDFSIISGLLLAGVLMRAKIVFIQRSFMPASIIAGLLGLILGPFALNVLPFSELIGTYPGMLIAFVFAALPFSTGKFKVKEVIEKVGGLWSYSQTIMILFYTLGLLFALVVLGPFFTDLHNGFGLLLAAGFVGGHGTAAAIGEAFALQGWEEATSIAMTSATVGALTAISIGLLLIKRAAAKGQTNYIKDFKHLPHGLRTGLLSEKDYESMGESRISSIVIDPLIYHVMFIAIATGIGYYLSVLGEEMLPDVAIPAFSLAFIVALLIRLAIEALGADKYLDQEIFSKISGGATDYLVAFGIASINLTVVAQNLVPFILLMIFGILLAVAFYRFLSGYYFQQNWFEKGIFTFGWITGAVAMAIALIRVADPKQESETLEDFGLAYVPIAPVEIALITFGPLFIGAGQHWLFVVISFVLVLMIYFFSYSQGWVKKSRS
ncbi:sodium/glutamate symporter [Lacicoccus alkaliphilus]|uniref:Glutamate:Na+ symporter, ESS family n=1 Tax=Lacicoccus alkaliphilus DSM 16010 TaxID=1123231 RepID=A0A1M7GIE3_9BACL|nr:sodium:glutamate symporter [Salinicoccus alkaliphilus]SHM15898.1 glutamate:Na+ symporter, ESS family [Salinicoccus alkaliphilus DSM 16010]